MIRPGLPAWLKRPDTLSFKSGFTGWWLSWFFFPIPLSLLLPSSWRTSAFTLAVPLSLFLLFKCIASYGRIHAGRQGIAWRIGLRRGWLPWEEIVEVREQGVLLPQLIFKHSQGVEVLPFQSIKCGAKLQVELLRRFPGPPQIRELQAWWRNPHLELVLFPLLFIPVQAYRARNHWSDYAISALGLLFVLVLMNSPLASSVMAMRVEVNEEGIRWQNRFFGRWRSLAWREITGAEFDLDAEDGSGVLLLAGSSSVARISGRTPSFLDLLRLTRASLPSSVQLKILTDGDQTELSIPGS